MTDAALKFFDTQFDLSLEGADLATDDGLNTAVCLSLFLDARAPAGEIPEGEDPRGYWADPLGVIQGDATGSLLWLLQREKQISVVADRAKEYAEGALSWLIDDGIAKSVSVAASFPETGYIELDVTITRPGSGDTFQRKYQYVWESYR